MAQDTTKISLITGASRGLGRNALALQKGWCHRDASQQRGRSKMLSLQLKKLAVKLLQLDTSNTKTFDNFVAQVKQALPGQMADRAVWFPRQQCRIGIYAPFAETTEEQFDQLINIQVNFFLTQKLLPLIKDGGRIVNMSSGLARFTLPGYAAYASTKGAIEVLTRYIAKELDTDRLRWM